MLGVRTVFLTLKMLPEAVTVNLARKLVQTSHADILEKLSRKACFMLCCAAGGVAAEAKSQKQRDVRFGFTQDRCQKTIRECLSLRHYTLFLPDSI